MASPITKISAAEQQHLLFLFLPIKAKKLAHALESVDNLQKAIKALPADGPDLRAATGVHFFIFYSLANGKTPGLPVPSFQTMPGKDLLVVQSIYDADFAPYISSFVTNPFIAAGLNQILESMDESDIPGVDPNGPTSANFILANGKVEKNPDAFNCLLMRYNFGDPTLAASSNAPGAKYTFGTNFPGLTIGKILKNYPDAKTIWPAPLGKIEFATSVKPICGK
jgi:hypothetical protein